MIWRLNFVAFLLVHLLPDWVGFVNVVVGDSNETGPERSTFSWKRLNGSSSLCANLSVSRNPHGEQNRSPPLHPGQAERGNTPRSHMRSPRHPSGLILYVGAFVTLHVTKLANEPQTANSRVCQHSTAFTHHRRIPISLKNIL